MSIKQIIVYMNLLPLKQYSLYEYVLKKAENDKKNSSKSGIIDPHFDY